MNPEFHPEPLGELRRTHRCGDLRRENAGDEVVLMGWVHRRRDLGGLLFLDLRDRQGLTQCVLNQATVPQAFAKAQALRNEFVVALRGRVAERSAETRNPNLPTGDIEIHVEELRILNTARPLPLQVAEEQNVEEGLRMQYRYLDLRRPVMAHNLALRHRLAKATRDYLDSQGFYEVETPILVASTPEGARDYLVPSRTRPGHFYALPQSPQLYKQILMVSGIDRYFQLARCFRDEDLRADRQPEFTQIDLEMSFVGMEDVLALVEGLMGHVFREGLDLKLPARFRRMSYAEAMDSYGSDKPDLRIDMRLHDVSELVDGCGFGVFQAALEEGARVKALVVPGQAGASRKEQDALKELAVAAGLPGLFFLARAADGVKSSLMKFLGEDKALELCRVLGAEVGDLVVLAAGPRATLNTALGRLRLEFARRYDLFPQDRFEFLWVLDFPLYSWNAEENRLEAEHHPFTSPLPEDAGMLESEPLKVRAAAYDLVLNGNELASGSIRIHQREMQEKVLANIGLSVEQAREKFGFLLDAFEFGAPPHGGLAVGFDRMVALCAGETSIREVIAFPKNANAVDMMSGAPVVVDPEQLDVLRLKIQPRD